MMPAVCGPMARLAASKSPNGTLSKPLDRRAEAVEIFRVAAGGDGGERAAVKGALERDQAIALRAGRSRSGVCAPS